MKLRLAFVCIFLLASFAAAADNPGGVPLIDRDLIFGNPEIAGAQLSPDGNYLAFLKPWKDTRNIYVKGIHEPFSAAHLLTTEAKRPVAGFFWTRDSKYVLYVKDNDGDENYNIFSVDPAASPAAGAEAPPSRDLTGLKGVRVQIFEVPKSDPDAIYIGLNDRDKAWHDLYKLKLSTGTRNLSARTPSASPDGSSIAKAICAWQRAAQTTVTPNSFASTPTVSARFTPATSSSPAGRFSSNREISVFTSKATKTPT